MTESSTERWDLIVSTPIGKQYATIVFETTAAGFTGVARGEHEDVPLMDVVRTDDRITWTQQITKPMKLTLTFEVTIDGDTLTGTSKAGRLPKSKVTGTRVQ